MVLNNNKLFEYLIIINLTSESVGALLFERNNAKADSSPNSRFKTEKKVRYY